MQLHAHQVIVSRVERRHEMRYDGDGNEENGGVGDRDPTAGSKTIFSNQNLTNLVLFSIRTTRKMAT